MCNVTGLAFGAAVVSPDEVRDQRVLEVGSANVNGGLRRVFAAWRPRVYLGVDLALGPGVDEVCAIERLTERFGENAFDLVVCTEVLEHVRDWRTAISQLKRVCREGGALLFTTRSPGFPYHAYPHDFWRYTLEDVRAIFADFELLALEPDPDAPGVFLKARKPHGFRERAPTDVALLSMITGARTPEVTEADFRGAHFRRLRRREGLQQALTKIKRLLFPDPYARK
jgi:SAM-dependent methyltransferase